jgi:hypothetical protein
MIGPPPSSPHGRSVSEEVRKMNIQEEMENMHPKLREELMMLGVACLIRSHVKVLSKRCALHTDSSDWKKNLDQMNYILHCRDRWDERWKNAPQFPTLRSIFRKQLLQLIHKYIQANTGSRVGSTDPVVNLIP